MWKVLDDWFQTPRVPRADAVAVGRRQRVHPARDVQGQGEEVRQWTSREMLDVRQRPPSTSTGTVRIDPLFQALAPARAVGASVTFEPALDGVAHPRWPTLIVTAGCGRRSAGRPVEEICQGRDLVPAGREALARCRANHGHNSHPIQEQRDGRPSTGWMVSDEQY